MQFGRGFLEEGTTSQTVVISDRLWRSQLHQALDVVGSTVEVGGSPRTVIGVIPSGFEFPGGVDAWMPIGSSTYLSSGLETVARLRPGISASQASAAFGAVGQRPAQGRD
jgi:hypothetical protein